MSLVLLDTDVVSFLIKGDTRVSQFESHITGNETAISLMTMAELFQWAFVRQWNVRRTAALERYLVRTHAILPIDIVTSRYWAEIRADGYHEGRPISPQDAWIAATALQYGIPLLTNNRSDFQQVKALNLVSPGA